MRRSVSRSFVRLFAHLLGAATLASFLGTVSSADDLKIKASFGIAGCYRPGSWCPVTVRVLNTGADTFSGQVSVQATAMNSPNNASTSNPAACLFARPVSIAPTSNFQNFTLDTRGIDPAHDTVSVQIAEGRERGDGRILGRITNDPSNSVSVVSGTAVGQNDLLLVGFGGDPGAFTFLSGQKLGVQHLPNGTVTSNIVANVPSSAPPYAQVAEAAAGDLPDKPAGYEGVDAVLLRSDAPLESLTEAQQDALKGWVTSGGHLVVCGGADPTRLSSPFYADLLPARIGAVRSGLALPFVGQIAALTLTPKPLPGIAVLSRGSDGQPLIVTGPAGAGQVTVLAYDPTTPPFRSWNGTAEAAYWQKILTGGSPAGLSSVLAHVAAREENLNGSSNGYEPPLLLSDSVMRAPSLDAPGTDTIGLFLVFYLLVLVPVNYLVLKRYDKREWAWVSIPALVLLFALGTFGVGYAAKGGSVFVNRAALIETVAGQSAAGVYSEIGLFSPQRTSYDITLPNSSAVAAIPNMSPDFPYRSYNSNGNTADDETYGQTRFVQTANSAVLQDASINMWAMRAFDSQATTDLGGAVDGGLTQNGGIISGTLKNNTSHALTDCALIFGGQTSYPPDMPCGGLSNISMGTGNTTFNQQIGLKLSSPGMNSNQHGTASDIRQRMRASLSEYVNSLEQTQNNYYNNGMQSPPDNYLPSPNEALLIGWNNDNDLAGPAPRVDGHRVTENDVSLVIIHIPVSGVRALAALPLTPIHPPHVIYPPQPYHGAPGYVIPSDTMTPSSSPAAHFGTVSRSSTSYRDALDAGKMTSVKGRIGKQGDYKGVVKRVIFNSSVQDVFISLDFFPQNPDALIGIVSKFNYAHFPPLNPLVGKQVMFSGRYSYDDGRPTIELTDPFQIKVVR